MPWNKPADTERIRFRLGFPTSSLTFVDAQMDIATATGGEEAITNAQARLTELETLDAEMQSSAIEIDHLTKADEVEFIQGGRTRALRRRYRDVVKDIAAILQMMEAVVPALNPATANALLMRS